MCCLFISLWVSVRNQLTKNTLHQGYSGTSTFEMVLRLLERLWIPVSDCNESALIANLYWNVWSLFDWQFSMILWVRWWTHFLHPFRFSQNRGFSLENFMRINIVKWQNQIQICQWHFTCCIFEHNDTNVKKLLFSFYKQIEWHNNFNEDSSSQQHYGKNLESCHKL